MVKVFDGKMTTEDWILLVSNRSESVSQVRECLDAYFQDMAVIDADSISEARIVDAAPPPSLIIACAPLPRPAAQGQADNLRQYPGCPVLLVCSSPDQARELEALEETVTDFIVEPAGGKTELAARIRRLIFCGQRIRTIRDTEKRLRKSEETLRQILDLVPHHIHAKDANGRFIMANKAVSESYHMTPEQFVGMSHMDIAMDREEALGMLRDDQEVIRTGHPKHIPEETCIDADGNVHWLETTKVPFENDGEAAVLIVANDITERKRAEMLAEMQRDIASGLAAAITMDEAVQVCLEAVLRIASVERVGIYLKAEDGGLALAGQMGRTADSPVLPSVYHPDTEPSLMADSCAVSYDMEADGTGWFRDTKADPSDSAGDGGHEPVRGAAIVPILTDGKPVACIMACCPSGKGPVPLSDRLPLEAVAAQASTGFLRLQVEERLRRTEAQFLQAQKMEAVGHLAGGVAHDFNNLLSAILGYSELSLIKLPETPEEAESFLHQVIKAGERARDLVQQLLAFSRKQLLEMKAADLNCIIINLEKMLHRLIGEQIILETDLATELWTVKVDTTQMEQILVNLAVNARDAMPDGGKLFLQTANLQGPLAQDDDFFDERGIDWVQLVIRDTGGGMDETTRIHAFEPFFTTKGKEKGTGLGLSTVYGIVKQHNGQIRLDSRPGQGATFTILLPRTIKATEDGRQSRSIPEVGKQNRGRETLLLVEDETVVRNLAEEILRQLGYTVLSAGDGSEALKIAKENSDRIDLLITDVIMPGMNGKDLHGHLCELIPGLQVLYVSGYDGDVLSRQGVLAADIRFLSKPFSVDSLARTVRTVLDES